MINTEIKYTDINSLCLDSKNPRLGRLFSHKNLSQSKILDLMKDWTLEELAISFVENGFWSQEALLVVEEDTPEKKRSLVVVEGNRRLAALKLLYAAKEGEALNKKWREITSKTSAAKLKQLFEQIPYIRADRRDEIQAYLGFRHVTGIKQWDPAEKAEFIAKTIDEQNLSYDQLARQIGSKISTIRQNYISYKLLLQIQDNDKISTTHVEEKFSVLYLSLRTEGVQKYLSIDIVADPKNAQRPVPRSKIKALENYALWLFGDDEHSPIITDSRYIDKFGAVLESQKAVQYLERAEEPSFEQAFRIAGGDETEVVKLIARAADYIELALSTIHFHLKSKDVHREIGRLKKDTSQLFKSFPDTSKES